jgi:hypothetical protein
MHRKIECPQPLEGVLGSSRHQIVRQAQRQLWPAHWRLRGRRRKYRPSAPGRYARCPKYRGRTAIAVPMPPPMHGVATPLRASRRAISDNPVTDMVAAIADRQLLGDRQGTWNDRNGALSCQTLWLGKRRFPLSVATSCQAENHPISAVAVTKDERLLSGVR